MKNLLYTLIITLFIPYHSFSQETNDPVDVNANWSGRGCRGTNGLCNIDITNNNMTNARIHYDSYDLILVIDRSKLTQEDESNLVSVRLNKDSNESELIFIMDDDFELEAETKTILNIPENLSTITKGEYPLEVTSDSIIITLKIE
ncbi:hypothetical protein [Olleya sp. YS]|uniref:hypothetical protein n=1 Tax=Olleya sp. YS TaxID=3028318 RepID=UPI0024342654|nr:hypothetical protein [Olleya sp. YS]WGD35645.1 hypothetical protein Ollyesu_04360 [Olleya sp. YS]